LRLGGDTLFFAPNQGSLTSRSSPAGRCRAPRVDRMACAAIAHSGGDDALENARSFAPGLDSRRWTESPRPWCESRNRPAGAGLAPAREHGEQAIDTHDEKRVPG